MSNSNKPKIKMEIETNGNREEYLIYVGKAMVSIEYSTDSMELFQWKEQVEAAKHLIHEAGGIIYDRRTAAKIVK